MKNRLQLHSKRGIRVNVLQFEEFRCRTYSYVSVFRTEHQRIEVHNLECTWRNISGEYSPRIFVFTRDTNSPRVLSNLRFSVSARVPLRRNWERAETTWMTATSVVASIPPAARSPCEHDLLGCARAHYSRPQTMPCLLDY